MDQEIFSNTAMHNFIAAIESSKQGGGKAALLGQGIVLVLTSAFPSEHTGKELDPTLVCQWGIPLPLHKAKKYQAALKTHPFLLLKIIAKKNNNKKNKRCTKNKRAAPALPRVMHCTLNYTFTLGSRLFINQFCFSIHRRRILIASLSHCGSFQFLIQIDLLLEKYVSA